MKAIVRRVGRLEDRYAIDSSGKLRIGVRAIISFPWNGPLSLATSTCPANAQSRRCGDRNR